MLIGMRVWLFLKWVWRIEEPYIPEPYRMGRRSIKWSWFEAGVVAGTCYRICKRLTRFSKVKVSR